MFKRLAFCLLVSLFFLVLSVINFNNDTVFAETTTEITSTDATILPSPTNEGSDLDTCIILMMQSKSKLKESFKSTKWDVEGQKVLACSIRTGMIGLWMVPYHIRYILEFIIQISGLACLASIVFGGFLYLFSGISEEKDKGKKAITYGVIGMVITFSAWSVVNIFILFLTG